MMIFHRAERGRHERTPEAVVDLARGQAFAVGTRLFAIPATSLLGETRIKFVREVEGGTIELVFEVGGRDVVLEEL